ncbi:MAG: ATPase [Lachnospiraceae bacterium]|nr:ATPase [Lachnospiraceae bacterium]
MEITVKEVNALEDGSYRLIDVRDDDEVERGVIPGAEAVKAAELLEEVPECSGKKLIVYCGNGKFSKTVAEKLEAKGRKAYSIKGGFVEWLLESMRKRSADDVAAEVACSLDTDYKEVIYDKFAEAIEKYELISPGDCIAVCISGGKDSMLLSKLFQIYKERSEINFEVKYIAMDPGYSSANRRVLEENAGKLKIPAQIFETDIFNSVFTIEKSPCYLCARMRRGYLYNYARDLGCNKIALGHHYDDVIETILMSMLYGGQIQTMMPKLRSTNHPGMELIRPLYLVREEDIKAWRDSNKLYFLQCACKFTEACAECGTEENISKRIETKKLIARLTKENPDVEENIFRAVENVDLDKVIAYKIKGTQHTKLV